MNPTESGWVVLAVGSLVALGIGVGILASNIAHASTKPMPCEEDAAYVWRDAPHTAVCIALDDLGVPR